MSVHFTLADIDPEVRQKEAINDSRFKPFSTHFLSKKRKVEELYDINNPASNLLIAADTIIEDYTDKVKTVDALTATLKKRTLELERVKQEIQVLKTKLAEKSDHADNNLIEEMKRDATIAVLESKIHMAEEASENGLDASLWNVKEWKDKLEKMKDDYALRPYFIGLGRSAVSKGKSTKAPKIRTPEPLIKGETSNPKGERVIAIADDPVESEGSSGEEGM